MPAGIRSEYDRRLTELQSDLAGSRRHQAACAIAVGAALAISFAVGFSAIRYSPASLWWSALPLVFAAGAAGLYRRFSRTAYRQYRLSRFYERAIRRLRGDWCGQGDAGADYTDATHAYARDLNIFGEGSLFELLSIARTGVGRRGLANYLLYAPPVAEILERQEAIRELRFRTDLRERVSVLGPFDSAESHWETFSEWLESPIAPFRTVSRLAILISSAVLAFTLTAGLIGLFTWVTSAVWVFPILLFHSAAGLFFRDRVNRMKASVYVLSTETQVLRRGLQLLENESFRSTKLRCLTAQVSKAPASVRKLEILLNAVNETKKDWFYLPSLALMLGTQLCMAIENWRTEHREALRAWLSAWAEFEALNSLACFCYENPDHAFPEFIDGEARFEARELGHPLLPRSTCVRNDVELNGAARLYVVSGSNMSGKSTLLRAIGTNAVLALAGAPVRASSLRLSHLSVCASISVVDSLLNGRSKFLEEVERLRGMIESSESRTVLFLIDEIFSGTNSLDRRTAAEAVIRTLLSRGAVGAISTHDLTLTEIAEDTGLHGANVHMGSRNGSDPMGFDYRLKAGVTRERNALAIARMAGVPL